MRALWVPVFLSAVASCGAVSCGGGSVDAGGVPVVADAVVDVAFADVAAFIDVVGKGAAAGLLPKEALRLSQSALEAAGVKGPVVVAVRAGGDVVVGAVLVDAARFQAALALSLPDGAHVERRYAAVDAVVVGGVDTALVRAKDGVAYVVVAPRDALAAATLIEALASGALAPARTVTSTNTTATTLTAGKGLLRDVPGLTALTGGVRVDGSDVVVDLHAGVEGELKALVGGLSAPAPPWSCAVEDGAALSLRLPPASAQALSTLVNGESGNDLDAFAGRVVLALHEVGQGTPLRADDKATWASVVVAGVPRAGAAAGLQKTLAESGKAPVVRTVGARRVLDLDHPEKPWRKVSAVVDEDVFALGVGASVVVDRAAVGSSCVESPGRLLRIDGKKMLAVLSRAAPELALLRSLGVDSAVLPSAVRLLQASERLEIDAVPRNESVDVSVRIRLAKQ